MQSKTNMAVLIQIKKQDYEVEQELNLSLSV